MTKTVFVRWQLDIVDEWFNSSNKGGFIKVITDNNFFNNLEELNITCINEAQALKRPPLKKEIQGWFKKKISGLKSNILAQDQDSRMVIIRGCTAQQRIGFLEPLKEYCKKTLPDEDALLRLGQRFTSHFISESGSMMLPEKFYNEYVDELFEYCKRYVGGKNKIIYLDSDSLTSAEIENVALTFFPKGTCDAYMPPLHTDNDNIDPPFILRESPDWFKKLFEKEGMEDKEELDSSSAALLDAAYRQVIEKLEKAI